MQYQIANLYCQPVTLFKVNVEGVAEFFETVIKPKFPNQERETHSQGNLANYHNEENIFEIYDELKPLKKELLDAAHFVYQEILNYDNELRFTNAWINECGIGGYQDNHNHCNSVLSGTVYLRTDENTNIVFPNQHYSSNIVPHISNDPNQEKENKYGYYYHKSTATFHVSDGDCMIWPSQLPHGYRNNQTPGRLSLSFNLFPTKLNCLYQV